ncbi:GumC family protein [Aliiruegeria lutimaris]|nr:hypothetical protein [Aliiruegeria lutimaris]
MMDGTMTMPVGAPMQDVEPMAPWHAAEAPATNPLAPLLRAMRGRWSAWFALSLVLGGAFGAAGFLSGTKTYESQAVLRVYPKEAGILYNSGDDSVLKTFDSFVKAETAFANSPDVMSRAAETLRADFPELTSEMTDSDLRQSVAVKRSDTLIVLDTKSKNAAFAAAKLRAVTDAYLSLKSEADGRQMRMRSSELTRREAELLEALRELDRRILEIGREYGSFAIAKAHSEKIAQIDTLATRKADVERTLASMRLNDGQASADMNDEHILRATLLDRGLADINIELARQAAELATLRERYTETSRQVRDKRAEIAILEKAMAERRNQIQVLGQTGALTDQSDAGDEDNIETIAALLAKVAGELEEARQEARALNAQRVELDFLEEERSETRRMLDDTRAALDVIRVESRKTSPGLTDIMSPAVTPDEPAEDSSKMQAAMGLVGGGMLASLLTLGLGLGSRRLRWSDELNLAAMGVDPLAVLTGDPDSDGARLAPEIDRLRTTLQLVPARSTSAAGSGRSLALLRTGSGGGTALAHALAESFSRTDLSVALLQIDPAQNAAPANAGYHVERAFGDACSEMSLPRLRRRIAEMTARHDVVLIDGGNLQQTTSASLVASAADYAIVELRRGEDKQAARATLERASNRCPQGIGAVFSRARRGDPGLSRAW